MPADRDDDRHDDHRDDRDGASAEPLQAFDPVRTARRRHGAAGAIVAAGMFGLDQALGRKPKEEAPIVMAASDEPIDIDSAGITVPVDDTMSVVAPPQPRSDPLPGRRRRRRQR